MNNSNPQIEAIIRKLAKLFCDSLKSDQATDEGKRNELLAALMANGYVHKDKRSLAGEVEAAIKQQCTEPAAHRTAMVSAFGSDLHAELELMKQFDYSVPNESGDAPT